MNTYTYTADTISDSQMLEYVHRMANRMDPYVSASFGPHDTMAFMQSVYRHLKGVWYGLSVAQMREDALFQSNTMYRFVSKWQDRWLHTSHLSKVIEDETKYQSICSGSCMTMHTIGTYCPFPEQIHEAQVPVIWNDHTPPNKL